MYGYEVKYKTSHSQEDWQVYRTMLYNNVESALRESENFEHAMNCVCVSKKLLVEAE